MQHIDFDDGGLRAVDDLRSRCAYWLDLEPYRTAKEIASRSAPGKTCAVPISHVAHYSGANSRPPPWLVLISQSLPAYPQAAMPLYSALVALILLERTSQKPILWAPR